MSWSCRNLFRAPNGKHQPSREFTIRVCNGVPSCYDNKKIQKSRSATFLLKRLASLRHSPIVAWCIINDFRADYVRIYGPIQLTLPSMFVCGSGWTKCSFVTPILFIFGVPLGKGLGYSDTKFQVSNSKSKPSRANTICPARAQC